MGAEPPASEIAAPGITASLGSVTWPWSVAVCAKEATGRSREGATRQNRAKREKEFMSTLGK
jgi:hypothetical protein